MFEKTETCEQVDRDAQREIRQRIEVTLHRLQELRGKVEELKRKCEEIRKMERTTHSEHRESTSDDKDDVPRHIENVLRCDRCGHALDPEQQVVVRDSNGAERSHYHKKCFQALFK